MKTTHLLVMGLCIAVLAGPVEGTVYINDGGTHTISFAINDSVEISGDGTNVYMVKGGYVGGNSLRITGNSSFVMTGGRIAGYLYPLGYKPIHVYGGTIGGPISLDANSNQGINGDLYIYGSDFRMNGVTVPYGTYHQNGRLTGILSNGDLIDNAVWCVGGNDLILMPVPEPATLILLAFGGLLLRRK